MNIKDIAKIANVGISTVSRVMNNHPDVKEETRNKVLEVIKKHNYVPNNSARNLKRSSSNNIGILVKGAYNPFFYEIINFMGKKIDKLGYSMILQYNDDFSDDAEAALEFIKEKKLIGLICLGGDFNRLHEEILKSIDVPIVLTSTNIETNKNKEYFSSVNIDNFKAAYDAVDYLCKKGHENISIITTGEKDTAVGTLRLKGYKVALSDNNLEFSMKNIEYGRYTFKSGYEAMKNILKSNKSTTAVFVISDIMAIGAARACLEENIRIPEDISIIGFDGIEYGEYYHPSITTIKQPFEYMANESVELMISLMSGQDNKHIILDTKIVERESCKNI